MKNVIFIAAICLLAACDPASAPVVPAVPTPTNDTCNANRYASLIGQDATALEKVLLLGQVRVIRPGQAVTMDFRPERINFNIAGDNRIASITCS